MAKKDTKKLTKTVAAVRPYGHGKKIIKINNFLSQFQKKEF